MKAFDFDKAFGQPPEVFRQSLAGALSQVKEEEKPMKRFSARTLILAAALMLALCGIALAVTNTYGVEWFLTERYADPPKLPENFKDQVQNALPQENTGTMAHVEILDAAWLDESYTYTPNYLQMTISTMIKEPEKYEMHEAIRLNNDGDTSERDDVDWLWTETGHGPIPEMMTDPAKQLVFFQPDGFTLGTPDGFKLPSSGEDSLQAADGSLIYSLALGFNRLDPQWLTNLYGSKEDDDFKQFLADGLKDVEDYKVAKEKYTGSDGLTTLVFNYSVWEYPDWQTKIHHGYVTFKVKLP